MDGDLHIAYMYMYLSFHAIVGDGGVILIHANIIDSSFSQTRVLELHVFHGRRVLSKSTISYTVSGKNPLIRADVNRQT